VVYCEQCGAANDIMNRQCHRCGRALVPGAESVPATTSSATSAAMSQEPVPSGSHLSLEIGQSLELPDWLKRAAGQTPPSTSSTAPASDLPPSGFHVAPSASAEPGAVEAPAESESPPRPLPPVPTADLPSAMPDWLKAQSTPEPELQPSDATDTASFITENDLPEWIRQIAAADAVKQAEEERLAADVTKEVEVSAPRRPILPGEAVPSAPAANPWLSRRDGESAEQAWGRPAAEARSAGEPAETVAAEHDQVAAEHDAASGGEPA
jgi:hypothetical protein